jgi:TonB family protein
MATSAQTRTWTGPSRRRVPRFRVRVPLDVTVLRSGIPDTLPGRSVNLCERGIAAVLAGEVVPGEAVGIEVRLPLAQEPLRTRATVRYQDRLRCGMEFVGLSPEQRAAIRDWVKEAKAEAIGEIAGMAVVEPKVKGPSVEEKKSAYSGNGFEDNQPPQPPRKERRILSWFVFLVLLAVAASIFWWRWNLAWEQLENGLKAQTVAADKPQAQVSAEVMEKLLVHRVEPVYPAEARQQRLEGIIALDIVVGRDGSVVSMHPLNGPDVLARAAMDALRWWKFEPYRVNGEPAIVETTVAVEFKR